MRVLITGAQGQVGGALSRRSWPLGFDVHGLGSDDLDITDAAAISQAIATGEYGLVINAAAFTAVDQAESEPARTYLVNRDGPAHLAMACQQADIPLVHFSTDFVFDGSLTRPYHEDDEPAPLNVYGASKAASEAAVRRILPQHVILRLSWVHSPTGRNFVRTIVELAGRQPELRVVDDQIGAPTSADDITDAVIAIAGLIGSSRMQWGTYHYASVGAVSWHGFARAILDELALRGRTTPSLYPICSADYAAAARRPANSQMNCSKFDRLVGLARRPWLTALPDTIDGILADIDKRGTL